MGVIRNVWVDAAGVPLRNAWVMTTLISRAGWSKTGQSRAVRVHSDMTDATGLWTSPDLPPQSSYEESGTYYRVECEGKIEHFDVPDAPGTYWLADRRRNPVPIDADWKVLAKLSEAPDAKALAGATDGQVPVWNTSTSSWQPVTRVTAQQLADGLASKAAKQYVDDADQALSNRVSSIELWRPGVDTALSGKASTTSVTGLQDRTSAAESDIVSLKQRVSTVEGGGSGSTGAVQHGSLRYLVTGADGKPVDDHPQYLTATRGDARYYPKVTADSTFAGLTHAARHRTGAADPLTPADIGAAPAMDRLGNHVASYHDGTDKAPTLGTFSMPAIADESSTTTTNYGIATKMVNRSTGALSSYRSLRQPVVHSRDVNLQAQVSNGFAQLAEFWFRTRERCHLLVRFQYAGYVNAGGSLPVGYTSTAFLSQYLDGVGADGSAVRLYNGPKAVECPASVGLNNYRPAAWSCWETLLPVECEANTPYRYFIYGEPHPSASTPHWGFFLRMQITEVVGVAL